MNKEHVMRSLLTVDEVRFTVNQVRLAASRGFTDDRASVEVGFRDSVAYVFLSPAELREVASTMLEVAALVDTRQAAERKTHTEFASHLASDGAIHDDCTLCHPEQVKPGEQR